MNGDAQNRVTRNACILVVQTFRFGLSMPRNECFLRVELSRRGILSSRLSIVAGVLLSRKREAAPLRYGRLEGTL
jgi:hypothetical protein